MQLVALGQAFVLNIGSIDLSNAAITVLGAILLAMTLGPLGAVAPLVVLIMVTLFGAVNGLIVAFAQVPSFALTLGTLGIFQAAALVVSGATTVYVEANLDLVAWLYTSAVAMLPMTFILGVVVAVVAWLFLRFTRPGQGMTAIGKNESGAIFSAVRNRGLKVVAYSLSGFMAGLAGITIIAQAGSASPMGLGSDLLLPGIAAAIVGGLGSPIGAIAGGFVIAFSEVMVTYAWKKVVTYLVPESMAPDGLVQLLTTDYKFAVSFAILIIVLIFMPTGLFKGKSV
mgnify:CR=1 FL=1